MGGSYVRTEAHKQAHRRVMMIAWQTPEIKAKMSTGMLGKHHSEETKRKIGLGGKGNKSRTGQKRSEAERLKHSINSRGINTWSKGRKLSPEHIAKLKEWRKTIVLPCKDTTIELKIQELLTMKEISFEKHKSIIGQPDVFIEPNICIFADGCYWHGCEDEQCRKETRRYGKTSERFIKRKEVDLRITKDLEANGFVVLRFWEHEIRNKPDAVLNRILEVI